MVGLDLHVKEEFKEGEWVSYTGPQAGSSTRTHGGKIEIGRNQDIVSQYKGDATEKSRGQECAHAGREGV
jgi:hypothetical protein